MAGGATPGHDPQIWPSPLLGALLFIGLAALVTAESVLPGLAVLLMASACALVFLGGYLYRQRVVDLGRTSPTWMLGLYGTNEQMSRQAQWWYPTMVLAGGFLVIYLVTLVDHVGAGYAMAVNVFSLSNSFGAGYLYRMRLTSLGREPRYPRLFGIRYRP